jgi:hypothetical protein
MNVFTGARVVPTISASVSLVFPKHDEKAVGSRWRKTGCV